MKDHVTVIVEDNFISVDGVTVEIISGINLVEGHEHMWALHWDDGFGEIEFTDDLNQQFDASIYDEEVAPYVEQFDAEMLKIQQEEERLAREAEIEYNKPENVEARAREHRNKLLAETDFMFTSDYPLTEERRLLWSAYRQSLRDLPEKEGWPMDIVWPSKPE